ncbi:MAG: hypothetical protein HOM96_01795 [Rickettsiales bacterium]|nr:hypothetical protein [Rickettsiales bacterium]
MSRKNSREASVLNRIMLLPVPQEEKFSDEAGTRSSMSDGSGATKSSIEAMDEALEGLLAKLDSYAGLVDERITQAMALLDDIVSNPSSSPATTNELKKNDIKKNIMTFYSLKSVLEVLSNGLKQSGAKSVEELFPSKDDIDTLISDFGSHPNPNHFDNSLTRVYLVHLPRIIDRFLKVSNTEGFTPKRNIAEVILLRKDEAFKDEDAKVDKGVDKQLEIEDSIQFVMNLLVLLNSIKVNKFYNHDNTADCYHYDFNPYTISEFTERPAGFVTAHVTDNDIAQLDELWMKNNYSNISQYITYLLCDILQVENLNYQDPRAASKDGVSGQVTIEDLCTNPGYPYTLKALNLAAIKKFEEREVNLDELEQRLGVDQKEEDVQSDGSLSVQDNSVGGVKSGGGGNTVFPNIDSLVIDEKEQAQPAPKNQMEVRSGFEIEVGIIDEVSELTVEQKEKYEDLQRCVKRALFNKATSEIYRLSEDARDEIAEKLKNSSRSELILLHLILCNELGENIAFMEMPRENMAQRIIGHLREGNLKQSITDLIYAYEVNIDKPCSLSETIKTAQDVESLLVDYYAPNFGVKIIQAPSFQLNLSMWVKDKDGNSINTACPAKQYTELANGKKTLQSVKYTEFYTHLLEEVNKELTKLITDEITGIFRCSKLVPHIDWKVYPLEERRSGTALASDATSSYTRHRLDTGKSASIRVVGGERKDSRFEIRLFGPNVHAEAQMPNKDTINENLFRQSDLLAIIAERVLIAVDRLNCREVYDASDLSVACNGLYKNFQRARGLSGSSSITNGSLISGYTGTSDFLDFPQLDDSFSDKVQSAANKASQSDICRVM